MVEALGREAGGPGTASAAVMEAKAKEKKDGVVKEVIRLERESVIPILKPKLVMKLAYLIGMFPIDPAVSFDRCARGIGAAPPVLEASHFLEMGETFVDF
jgi:hypothetical protein